MNTLDVKPGEPLRFNADWYNGVNKLLRAAGSNGADEPVNSHTGEPIIVRVTSARLVHASYIHKFVHVRRVRLPTVSGDAIYEDFYDTDEESDREFDGLVVREGLSFGTRLPVGAVVRAWPTPVLQTDVTQNPSLIAYETDPIPPRVFVINANTVEVANQRWVYQGKKPKGLRLKTDKTFDVIDADVRLRNLCELRTLGVYSDAFVTALRPIPNTIPVTATLGSEQSGDTDLECWFFDLPNEPLITCPE